MLVSTLHEQMKSYKSANSIASDLSRVLMSRANIRTTFSHLNDGSGNLYVRSSNVAVDETQSNSILPAIKSIGFNPVEEYGKVGSWIVDLGDYTVMLKLEDGIFNFVVTKKGS